MNMMILPVRLLPGQDVRDALAAILARHGARAAFVLQGIGSLRVARLRPAGLDQALALQQDLELLTLAGTLSPDGCHLHASVSDAGGKVFGGHVEPGCVVRTTAEILLALLPDHTFSREWDPASGFKELVIR